MEDNTDNTENQVNTQNLEPVNMDALLKGDTEYLNDVSTNEGLPTQDDITAEIEGSTEEEQTSTEETKTTVKNEQTQQKDNTQQNNTELDWAFNELSTRLSTAEAKYEIPEEIKTGKNKDGKVLTAAEKFDILRNEIYKNTEFETDDDDFIKSYKQAKQTEGQNFDFNKFVGSVNTMHEIDNLPSDQYMELALKQRNEKEKLGWTDEDIKEYISKLGKIDLDSQVSDMKTRARQIRQQESENRIKAQKEAYVQAFTKDEEKNQTIVNSYIESIRNKTNFNGIEISKADKDQFIKDLPEMLKRDIKTGRHAVEEILQSNDAFLQLMPFIWLQNKGKLAAAISDLKEQVKNNIENKLDVSTKRETGKTSGGSNNKVDYNRLYS